jgi:hypothetical protein
MEVILLKFEVGEGFLFLGQSPDYSNTWSIKRKLIVPFNFDKRINFKLYIIFNVLRGSLLISYSLRRIIVADLDNID